MVVLLISSIGYTNLVNANPIEPDYIHYISPIKDATYSTDNIETSLTFVYPNHNITDFNLNLYLDGQCICPLNFTFETQTVLLKNLTQGEHEIHVMGDFVAWWYGDQKVKENDYSPLINFYIDYTQQQPIQTAQPTNNQQFTPPTPIVAKYDIYAETSVIIILAITILSLLIYGKSKARRKVS
jgi:hypothetical protein